MPLKLVCMSPRQLVMMQIWLRDLWWGPRCCSHGAPRCCWSGARTARERGARSCSSGQLAVCLDSLLASIKYSNYLAFPKCFHCQLEKLNIYLFKSTFIELLIMAQNCWEIRMEGCSLSSRSDCVVGSRCVNRQPMCKYATAEWR